MSKDLSSISEVNIKIVSGETNIYLIASKEFRVKFLNVDLKKNYHHNHRNKNEQKEILNIISNLSIKLLMCSETGLRVGKKSIYCVTRFNACNLTKFLC